MKPKANYLSKQFGQLKVTHCIEPSDGNNKGGKWMCMCKCRRMITLSGYQLHSRKSCGCLSKKHREQMGKNNRKSFEEKMITIGYRKYRRDSHNPISREKWKIMMKFPCHYCNAKTDYVQTEIEQSGRRTDTTICNICRKMKNELSHIEFIQQIECIYLINKKPA